jgi:hypothetical protein
MAYPVRTSGSVGGQAWLVTMQQKVGDQIVNWREETFDQQGQLAVDINWEPQQLEIDQSSERTRTGASWLESYTEVIRPSGAVPTTTKLNETWTVVGQEVLQLPNVAMTFQCVVFQKSAAPPGMDAGTGTGTDGGPAGDAGKPMSDSGIKPPMLTSESLGHAPDGSVATMPKTLWYARGYGRVKEAGGNEPTEELSGLDLK